MSNSNALIRFVFGGVIFLFSLALAYFTADYIDPSGAINYWFTLAISAILYLGVGIGVMQVYPISLAFLFSADVLLLHVLGEKYDGIGDALKLVLIGVILIILYVFAWGFLRDSGDSSTASSQVPLPPQT